MKMPFPPPTDNMCRFGASVLEGYGVDRRRHGSFFSLEELAAEIYEAMVSVALAELRNQHGDVH